MEHYQSVVITKLSDLECDGLSAAVMDLQVSVKQHRKGSTQYLLPEMHQKKPSGNGNRAASQTSLIIYWWSTRKILRNTSGIYAEWSQTKTWGAARQQIFDARSSDTKLFYKLIDKQREKSNPCVNELSVGDSTYSSSSGILKGWREHLSRDMRFPTMWYVRPAKAKTSLRIRAV